MIGTRPSLRKAERNLEILEQRRAGKKLREIAEQYGLAVERVRQIVNNEERLERYERIKKEDPEAWAEMSRYW